ncbi:hypothetical protein P3X46_009980 [Hevea brasiliensis]|uniref:Uncharacterized protein n=1 Tax=Hevea brasiliensis TaxID=3981 RepID=A0ABQ9MCU1_HEVBR|nr:hypothetical protein P3X46_009980 [Hevea brasiliensis]
MAHLRASSQERNGIIKLKIAAKKLQKRLSLGKNSSSSAYFDECEEVNVPNDVKEGHFAVIAVDNAEEYGFDHEGALAIPCRPSELEKILADELRTVSH